MYIPGLSQRADSQTKILSGQGLKKAQQDLNLHEIVTPVIGTVRIIDDSQKTGQVPNVQLGKDISQGEDRVSPSPQVDEELYPVTEGTCETSRTSSLHEGEEDRRHSCSAVGKEDLVCGSSGIARLAYRIVSQARVGSQSRTVSEALRRQEFQVLLREHRRIKRDPGKRRESEELKSRLIDLHRAIRSPMVIPNQQSTRSKKPQPETAGAG